MGRLCGGAHEISGIKAPIFLHGWVGVVGLGVVVGWGGWCWGEAGWVVSGDGGTHSVDMRPCGSPSYWPTQLCELRPEIYHMGKVECPNFQCQQYVHNNSK